MMFSYTYETRYGDYKDLNNIKPGSILDMIQDVSTRASAHHGYDIQALYELKRAWLLQGINLMFTKPIKPDKAITLNTAVKPCNGVTSERCCIIEQEGDVVGKSVANWFLFDVEKHRPVRIPEDMMAIYEVADFDDEFFCYKKNQIRTIDTVAYEITVSNKEIDTNMHMNNQKGAEILMDALPFDFYFNHMNILYKKPTFLGDYLEVCVEKTENGYYVHLQTTEKEICVAGTFEYIENK